MEMGEKLIELYYEIYKIYDFIDDIDENGDS